MKKEACALVLLLAAFSMGPLAQPAAGQTIERTAAPGSETVVSMVGTVVSASPSRLTVRSQNGIYIVFIFDRYTRKTATLTAGTMVTVVSLPTAEQGVRLATDILPYTAPAAAPASADTPAAGAAPSTGSAQRSTHPYETGEAVPVSVRKLESSIEKQSRKFSAGFRTGVGLDPEVMLIGVQARMGPFFNRNFSFRPNVDFGFGEVTKMFVVDLNGVFRLPLNPKGSKWSMFAGAGPAFTFLHRNFEAVKNGTDKIDFGDFDFQPGLNILTGVDFRSGLFMEFKTTVWAGPHMRLAVGYQF